MSGKKKEGLIWPNLRILRTCTLHFRGWITSALPFGVYPCPYTELCSVKPTEPHVQPQGDDGDLGHPVIMAGPCSRYARQSSQRTQV